MRCKHDLTRNAPSGLVEAEIFVVHSASNRFEHRKRTVAFIQMEDAGRYSHSPQGAEPSNPKQQFLANSHSTVAAIQSRRQIAVLRRVTDHVGIEKEQITAPDFQPPHSGAN